MEKTKDKTNFFENALNLILRRKQFMIYPEFQMRFIGYILATAMIVALLFLLNNLYFYYASIEMAQSMGMEMEIDFLHFLTRQNVLITMGAALGAVLSAIVVSVAGLFLSHRLVGPLIRYRNCMRAYLDHNTKEHLEFRKNDFFKEFADLYNDMVNKKKS